MNTATIENILPKPYKRAGQVYQPKGDTGTVYNAEIVKGTSIRIFGQYGNVVGGPKAFDRTFKIGDTVEYDSYNLSYTGKISAIGLKTVTVVAYEHETHRLDLNTFCWRNWDFDLEEIQKRNSSWSD